MPFENSIVIYYIFCLPVSVVGIAAAYGLYGPGNESRWGRDFRHLSRLALRPTQQPLQWYRVFLGSRIRPGRDADLSPPSIAEVKNRVGLYLYSPYGSSWPMKGRNVHTIFLNTPIEKSEPPYIGVYTIYV